MATALNPPLDLDTEREKYLEFVDGDYVQRPPGSGTHSDCQYNLTRLLKNVAKTRNAKARQEWTVAHGTEWLTPDVLLTHPGEFETDHRGYLTSTPFLCVEILSPGQNESDLFRKCRRYHSWGVPHCWIVDPQTTTCFEHHGGDSFKMVESDGTLTAGDLQLAVAAVFAE